MVNEPSVFELSSFDCISPLTDLDLYRVHLPRRHLFSCDGSNNIYMDMLLALQTTSNVLSHDCLRPMCYVQTLENTAGDSVYYHGGVLATGIPLI